MRRHRNTLYLPSISCFAAEALASAHLTSCVAEATIELEVAGKEHPYIVVPCTFYQNEEASFTISMSSDIPCSLQLLTQERDWSMKAVESSWAGKTAGGCRNFSTFLDNPQYVISVPEGGEQVQGYILLNQEKREDFDDLGLYVIQPHGGTRSIAR